MSCFVCRASVRSLCTPACSPVLYYVWLARRFPIYGRGWRRNFVLHFLITTALVLLTGVIFFQLITAPLAERPPFRELDAFLLLRLLTESLPFWAMIALIHALEFHRRYRQREFLISTTYGRSPERPFSVWIVAARTPSPSPPRISRCLAYSDKDEDPARIRIDLITNQL